MSEDTERLAFDLLAHTLGLDEFQRIAAWNLMRDLKGAPWPPSPEDVKRYMQLGAIVSERFQ